MHAEREAALRTTIIPRNILGAGSHVIRLMRGSILIPFIFTVHHIIRGVIPLYLISSFQLVE